MRIINFEGIGINPDAIIQINATYSNNSDRGATITLRDNKLIPTQLSAAQAIAEINRLISNAG